MNLYGKIFPKGLTSPESYAILMAQRSCAKALGTSDEFGVLDLFERTRNRYGLAH